MVLRRPPLLLILVLLLASVSVSWANPNAETAVSFKILTPIANANQKPQPLRPIVKLLLTSFHGDTDFNALEEAFNAPPEPLVTEAEISLPAQTETASNTPKDEEHISSPVDQAAISASSGLSK